MACHIIPNGGAASKEASCQVELVLLFIFLIHCSRVLCVNALVLMGGIMEVR